MPPTNIQMLKITKLEPNLYFSNKKIEYVSLDKPIDKIEVLAACKNKSQLAKKLSKEPVKKILRQYIGEKKEYTAPKNV